MSAGGLLQLIAYGSQDIYLTANPQQTFFDVTYRRHTNFAMESLEWIPKLPEITEERREFLDSLMVFFFMPPRPDDPRELYRNGGPSFREWSREAHEMIDNAIIVMESKSIDGDEGDEDDEGEMKMNKMTI